VKLNCSYAPQATSGNISPALGVIARTGALPSTLVVAITSPLSSELRENASVPPAMSKLEMLPPPITLLAVPLAMSTANSGCWPRSAAVV